MKIKFSKLVYFFAETHYFSKDHSVLVVNIVGPLVKDNITTFEECGEEIFKSKSKWIILNFRDVSPDVDLAFLPLLGQLQKKIRGKPAHLRLSGLHPDIRKVLQDQNLVFPDELVNNLSDALKSLPDPSSS